MRKFLGQREFATLELVSNEPCEIREDSEITFEQGFAGPVWTEREITTTFFRKVSYLPGTDIRQGPYETTKKTETHSSSLKGKVTRTESLFVEKGRYFNNKKDGEIRRSHFFRRNKAEKLEFRRGTCSTYKSGKKMETFWMNENGEKTRPVD